MEHEMILILLFYLPPTKIDQDFHQTQVDISPYELHQHISFPLAIMYHLSFYLQSLVHHKAREGI